VVCRHSCTTKSTGWTCHGAREGHFQARPHDVSLFAWTGTTVPRRSRHSSHRSCIATSATFHQPTPAHCASLSTQTHTVVGLFRLLVRRSGTHCQMNSEIWRVMLTASNSSLKQSCSALTSVTSALEVIFNVMRSINPRFTYLLYFTFTLQGHPRSMIFVSSERPYATSY